MFSLLLLASVRAQDLISAAEADIPAFVVGQVPSIDPMETMGLDFGMKVALLPKFPPIEAGTEGKIQVAEDGFGLALMIGPQVLDILLSQIPEPGLPDQVDTIGFVAGVHASDKGPALSFALDFKGADPLQLCFSDTVMNVAKFMEHMDRRLQTISHSEMVTQADMPAGVAPTIGMAGTTEVITFPVMGEYISDGTAVYEINKLEVKLTPPDNMGGTRTYATAELDLLGPDPAFKFTVDAIAGNTKGPMFGSPPIAALDLPTPDFCESDSAVKMNVAAITGGMVKEAEQEVDAMDLEDVGDSAVRRLTGVEANEASKNIALHVLKKLHSGTEMFQAYKQEKERLVRMAFIQYSVAAVLALALLFSAGAVARHSFRSRKWDALAVNDEEALREGAELIQ
jgi:hypothetical protein